MSRRVPEELSVGELEQLLVARRAAEREQRLRRAQAEGRVVLPDSALAADTADATTPDEARIAAALAPAPRRPLWRWLADRALLLVEVAAVVALLAIVLSLWATNRQLNSELAAAQAARSAAARSPSSS